MKGECQKNIFNILVLAKIKMNVYPNEYFEKVDDITMETIKKHNIKALILDVDNTLIDRSKYLRDGIVTWAKEMIEKGIVLYILSNSNDKQKIQDVADKIGIEYSYFAKKPLKSGFLKTQKKLNIPHENIAVVGDQIFTDIIGGNACKMKTILVDPIKENDFWYVAWKRPIEERIKGKIRENKKGIK